MLFAALPRVVTSIFIIKESQNVHCFCKAVIPTNHLPAAFGDDIK